MIAELELTREQQERERMCRAFQRTAIELKCELLVAQDEIRTLKARIAQLEMKLYPVIEEERICGKTG